MRIKIIEDTAISGTPAFVGDVMDVDEATFGILKRAGKAVALPIVAESTNPSVGAVPKIEKTVKKTAKKKTTKKN